MTRKKYGFVVSNRTFNEENSPEVARNLPRSFHEKSRIQRRKAHSTIEMTNFDVFCAASP